MPEPPRIRVDGGGDHPEDVPRHLQVAAGVLGIGPAVFQNCRIDGSPFALGDARRQLLFNHFVRAAEKQLWHLQAKRFGDFEIDH